jgi:GAF domain-containing protein
MNDKEASLMIKLIEIDETVTLQQQMGQEVGPVILINKFNVKPEEADQLVAAWADYHTPAVGVGIHAWMLEYNRPIRLTQAELEAHPAWLGFGSEAEQHPPMRGWLATPIIDRNGTNWGLLQLSDKYEGDLSAEDERKFVAFAGLVSTHLEALWDLRNSRKQTTEHTTAITV